MKIGEKIFYLRTRNNCSQEELAFSLGVSRQTISKWELGLSIPDTDKIVDISNYLQVSTDFLLKDNYGIDNLNNLDRVVIRFMNSARDMDDISTKLLEMTRDGIIDDIEKKELKNFIQSMDNVINVVDELKNLLNL